MFRVEWFVVMWGVGVGGVVFDYLSVVHLGDLVADVFDVGYAFVSSSFCRGGS